jgi:hypothetical protein
MSFQKTIINIAVVTLIIMLGFIGYMMYKSSADTQYPPDVAECPDYWTVVGLERCQNKMGLGSCGGGIKDFSGADWQGQGGLKKKLEWSKGCGLVWDGVTNNTSIISM